MPGATADEDELVARTLSVVDEMYRMGLEDAPARARQIMRQYARRAGDARKRLGEIVAYHEGRRIYDKTDGPTAETVLMKKYHANSIKELVGKGHLDYGHEKAAEEIAECFESACRAGMAKARDYRMAIAPPKKRGPWRAEPTSAAVDRLRALVYLPWTRALHETKALDLPFVLDIVVDGCSLDAARKRCRVSWNRGLKMLKRSLSMWVEVKNRAKGG